MKLILLVSFILFTSVYSGNKYSKEANQKTGSQNSQNQDDLPSLRTLQKPFRMAKLNLLWAKAQHVNICYLFF